MAFGYYWYVVIIYFFNESAAYHLSELIEDHAYETYDGYLKNHEEMLKSKPVPNIAEKYYVLDNPFLFDLFCVSCLPAKISLSRRVLLTSNSLKTYPDCER